MIEAKNILEINLTMIPQDEGKKYSSNFPDKISKLLSSAEENNIRVSFIHNLLELKTRDYVKNDENSKFNIYNLCVVNINQEISLEEYYKILEEILREIL